MRNRFTFLVAIAVAGGFAADAQTPPDIPSSPIPNPAINRTTGFAADTNGNLYLSIAGQNKVYKRNAAGEMNVYAGTGDPGFSGDNAAAMDAQLNSPWGLFLDASGNLYIADTGNARVRKVDGGTGAITTVAGNGTAGSDGDGDLATNAQLNTPQSLTADATGNLIIADPKGARLRRIATDSGLISTLPLDDGIDPLTAPYGIVPDADGAIFAVDNGTVYKLDGGKLKKASMDTVSLAPPGVFFAPSLQQIAYPAAPAPVPLSADVDWVPASCPPPGTNPGSGDCVATARLMVNLQRLPAKSTLEVKPFGVSDTVGLWTIEDIQFSTLTGTGSVTLVNTTLPIQLNTASGPMQLDIDVPLSAIRVKVTVSGSVQINATGYKFSLSGALFP